MQRTNRVGKRCDCKPHIEHRRLRIDATDCVGSGRIGASPDCRATVIAALDASITAIETHTGNREHHRDERAVGVLVAAARFATLVGDHDGALARRAYRQPIEAAREALVRGGRVGELAAVTGLAEAVHRNYDVGELNSLTSAAAITAMLHDIEDAGDLAPEELRARYDERLRAVIENHGIESVRAETGVEAVEALANGDSPDLTLEEAATVLALDPDEPDADAIITETRDHLLLGMTTAVLDVEAVESGLNGSLEAREIQQKIEGRLAIDLDELAQIHGYIEHRKP